MGRHHVMSNGIKIYISNQSKQSLGGGFISIENFKKGCGNKAQFVGSWQEADVVIIFSVTMTTRDEITAAKQSKKKIVVRIDNMPKDSRNRGTAFSRMRDFTKLADKIIFQSQWAKDYVGTWLKIKHGIQIDAISKVIYNGVDSNYFFYEDNPSNRGNTYLYCSYNTDENKRFPEAAYHFYQISMEAIKNHTPPPSLTIVGQFSDAVRQYNFDFFNEEKVKFIPPIADRMQMGSIYKQHKYLYFPAFADASPNTVSEAIACGCEVLLINSVGGTKEVVDVFRKKIITIQDNANEYLDFINK
jgi:glycosyltransferase involved in cell wall biosynthesis